MTLAILLAAGVVAVLSVITGARWLESAVWRRSLVIYELNLPTDLDTAQLTTWLSSLAALTHAPRGALLTSPPVAVETYADQQGIRQFLLVTRAMDGAVLASLRAALPGVRLAASSTPSPLRGGVTVAAAVRQRGRSRQMGVERSEALARVQLAGLQPLGPKDSIRWQWLLTGALTPPPLSSDAGRDDGILPWWLEGHAPSDADEQRAARLKQREPLLHVAGRLVVRAPSRRQAYQLFGQAWGSIRLLNVPGAQLVRSLLPSTLVAALADHRYLPLLAWPLRLNSAEMTGLLGFPVGEVPLPGLPAGVTRQVPPPVELPSTGTVLADSGYPGYDRPLAISRQDRRMHCALLGPTGTGKSTLMINMALQDAAAGDGLAVLDPKADMAADLIARLPNHRLDDVVLVNPADTSRPVGFNVLANNGTEADRELAVDHVLHVFREQWKDFWGPRTDAVLRASLLTLVNTTASDGSAFTVCELPPLLTNTPYRRWLTARPEVPAAVTDFFTWFEALSGKEQTQVVGPVLNKLTALTQRTPLRLLLGQSGGIDLADVLQTGKLLIMPLSRGLVGSETAALLSSLMFSSLWQATLGRARLAQAKRPPYWLYVDEAAEVVRLPLDLGDVMAEARGYGVGLTLATQHLKQLPPEVRDALLATVRSRIVFQVEDADARVLARSFEPSLTAEDLRSLPAHEVAMQLCINGRTSRPMTGITRPLPDATADTGVVRARSRERYGRDRAEVERGLRDRQLVPNQPRQAARSSTQFGQRPRRRGTT